jgi:hypothetical protein
VIETNEDHVVLRILAFLGDLYDINADFCQLLGGILVQAGRTPRAPTSDVVCRTYQTGVWIHSWVEVIHQGEESLTWELEIGQHNEGWLIDARVARVGEFGTNTVLQFADKVVPNFAVVELEVPPLLRNLHEAGTKILKEELIKP